MKISRHGKFLIGAAFLFGATLTGCKVGPEYQAPPVYVPVSYTQIDESQGVIQHPCADLRDWWSQWDDPVLAQLVGEGLQNNHSLREAAMRVLEYQASVGISDSQMFPWFSGDGAYTRSLRNRQGADSWQLGVGMTWEIDVFGRLQRIVESSEAELRRSEQSYRDVYLLLLSDIASEYVNVRAYQQQIEITEQNIRIRKDTLSLTQEKHASGAVSQLDVSRSEGSYESIRAELPALKESLRQSLNRMSLLLGKPPGYVDPLLINNIGPIPETPEQILVGIPAELIRRRPDVRAAEELVIAQTANIGVAVGDLYPMFSLNGDFGVSASDFSKMFKTGAPVANIGPSFRWNILNFGRYQSNVRMQEFMQQEYILAYQRTVLEAAKDVDDNLAAYVYEKDRVILHSKSVDAYDMALKLSEQRYRAGTDSIQPVLDSQRDKLAQETLRTQSQANAIKSVIQLYRALGGGWMGGAPGGSVNPAHHHDVHLHEQGPAGPVQPAPAPAPMPQLSMPVPPAVNEVQPVTPVN